jgi:hypothetical protein
MKSVQKLQKSEYKNQETNVSKHIEIENCFSKSRADNLGRSRQLKYSCCGSLPHVGNTGDQVTLTEIGIQVTAR